MCIYVHICVYIYMFVYCLSAEGQKWTSCVFSKPDNKSPGRGQTAQFTMK